MVANLEDESSSQDRRSHFASIWSRTHRRAYQSAYRMTGNREDAEDVTQEAYCRAFRSFDQYDQRVPFGNWFFRILHNANVDRLRRGKRLRTVSLDVPADAARGDLEEIADDRPGPESLAIERLSTEHLLQALRQLPAPYREAVWMRDVRQMSYDDIAHATRSLPQTVRTRIHRGRQLLRSRLHGNLDLKEG